MTSVSGTAFVQSFHSCVITVVLAAPVNTVASWSSDYTAEFGMGSVDPEAWQSGIDIMASLPDSVVAPSLVLEDLVTDELQP